MSLIADKNIRIFDTTAIQRNDCIRVKRAGDSTARNGIVTSVSESTVEVLFGNIQNKSTSFLRIDAVDVAVGVWEIYWTTDFVTINYENNVC